MKKIFMLLRDCFFVLVLSISSVFATEIDASVEWSEKRAVDFALEGIISAVNINQGDSFEKGQTLLSLDNTMYKQNAALLKAKLSGLVPVFDDADREYKQAKILYEQTTLSDVELQKVQVSFEVARANLDQVKAQYRIAQWELENASFIAPWSGYVLESNVLPGRFISKENNQQPLLILVRSDRLKAVGWVNKSFADSVKVNSKASVEINNKKRAGQVVEIRRNMSSKSDRGNYRLTVEFNYDDDLPSVVGQAAVIHLP